MRNRNRAPWLIWGIVIAAFAALIAAMRLADWLVEFLWFRSLDHTQVFITILLTRIGLFVVGFAVFFLYVWGNLHILARKVEPHRILRFAGERMGEEIEPIEFSPQLQSSLLKWGIFVLAALPSLLFALAISGSWDTVLLFVYGKSFGLADPIFHRDVGFYLFTLPFIEVVQNSVVVASILVLIFLGVGYRISGQIDAENFAQLRRPGAFRGGAMRHLAVNACVLLAAWGWGYYLDRFHLLTQSSGAVYGAGYTEAYVNRPVLWVLLAGALVLIGILVWAVKSRRPLFVALGVGCYAALIAVGLGVLPSLVQSFVVQPNELALETPFLRYNIAFTRKAYGLDKFEVRSYTPLPRATPENMQNNQATIKNIRLWDWRPLLQTFRQLQQIRAYYEFYNVDVDRYHFKDDYREVMLSARELAERLPGKANTWVNQHLQYTHGFGLAMTLTAEKTDDGNPVLIVKNLPPRSTVGLRIDRPEVYYGEEMPGYRIVNTGVRELDYPRGNDNVYTNYQGKGGILIDSLWRRLLFAWHQFDINILLTSYIDPGSRIQLWRDVKERVSRIVPFLRLDGDPYLVVEGGRLFWIQDLYTTSSQFPYSEPYRGDFNYMRNSVKAVVDVYNGSVRFYIADPEDPIIRTYRAIFPDLFLPLEKMPEGLHRHLRYPRDLFQVQVQMYNTYHMTVPQVFYNSEDVWSAPNEKYAGNAIPMKPYYILMRIPGEKKLEFLLMTPLTPDNRDNMIAWMAARSDFPDYGKVIVFQLPKERLILGPMQIEAQIDQNTLISRQLSLWDQRGSRVIRGNLLVIPMDKSFIYVEPVYLLAEGTDIPQLQRVIVLNGNRVAMEPTLKAALRSVFGQQPPAPAAAAPAAVVQPGRLKDAQDAFSAVEKALRQGNWEQFGQKMQELKKFLTPGPASP